MKTRYRKVIDLTYDVDGLVDGRWVPLGVVQRHGSLPSMRGWKSLPFLTTNWGPTRQTRDRAKDDLVRQHEDQAAADIEERQAQNLAEQRRRTATFEALGMEER